MHALGLTAAQDAWLDLRELEFWKRVHADGELDLRFRAALIMEPGQSLAEWRDRLDAYEAAAFGLRGGDHLDAGILKGFVDGVIEARTAAMLEPYEDDTSRRGLPTWEPDALDAFVARSGPARLADRAARHRRPRGAIGARRLRTGRRRERPVDGRPARIQARSAGTWSTTPSRGAHPSASVARTWGNSRSWASWRPCSPITATRRPTRSPCGPATSGLSGRAGHGRGHRSGQSGGRLAFGSDWPVVPYDPFIALNNAVNRQTTAGEPAGGWLPSERLPLEAALEAHTAGSAWAAFAEHRRGRVTPGADADVVILDRDLLAAGPSAIIGTTVRATVLGGRPVYRSEEARMKGFVIGTIATASRSRSWRGSCPRSRSSRTTTSWGCLVSRWCSASSTPSSSRSSSCSRCRSRS